MKVAWNVKFGCTLASSTLAVRGDLFDIVSVQRLYRSFGRLPRSGRRTIRQEYTIKPDAVDVAIVTPTRSKNV